MSTVGQAAGGLVGGIAGFFIGGPSGAIYGAQIGIMAGGYLDPPKGPKGRPPSASDLAVQTATYGAAMGDGDGTYGTMGNIFWVEGNSLRATEHQASGGKGGAPAGPATYDITGTFAVGFGEGEIDAFGKIWCSGKLVRDPGSTSVGTIIANGENGGYMVFYTGSPTQSPDPRIQADMGAANTPAYRGLHYIVFYDWPMADYGNTLMGLQVKAEIIHAATVSQYARRVYVPDGLLPDTNDFPGAGATEYGYFNPRVESGVFMCDKASEANDYAYTFGVSFEGNLLYQRAGDTMTGSFGYIGSVAAGVVSYSGTTAGTFSVGGSSFKLKTADPNNTCHGMSVGADGRIYALERLAGAWLFNIYDGSDLTLISSGANNSIQLGDNTISIPCIPGTNVTFCVESDGAHVWTAQEGGGNANFLLCTISSAGDLTTAHAFSEPFLGSFARLSAIYAVNGLCYGVNDAGGFYIFDRNTISTPALVPLADIIERRSLKSGLLESADIDVSEITQMVRGYKVASIASIRSSLEPLQAAWPFDVIPHGYQIKFVPRGQASVATIDISELGCVAGSEKPGVRITASREMDSQLPRKVLVSYLDVNREYDLNTGPGAERLNTDAINVEQIDLAIVMSATEAAQAEEVLLYLRWLERHDVTFVLPPTYQNLEAADVVTINGDTATYELRLTQINYLPDGRLECSAKFNNVATYTSSAVAQEALSPVQVLTYGGASVLALLDIPCVDSTLMDKPGFISALDGYSSDWTGGTLYSSDDGGSTWNALNSLMAPGSMMGTLVSAPGSGRTDVIDCSSIIVARFYSDANLSSLSFSALYSGRNHFAVGANGRWEIIGVKTVVDNGDNTWTLSDLLRGRYGSEANTGSHIAGDSIVLLDSSRLSFIGMSISSIGLNKLYCGVTLRQSLDPNLAQTFSYSAENLTPLAPVRLSGYREKTTYDWIASWTRRSRTPVEPFSGVSTPLAESSELYEAELWDSAFTTLKRTVTGLTSPSIRYTQAQQIADFGSEPEQITLKVKQVSSIVGNGHALTGSIICPSPGDQYFANVAALMPMDTNLVDLIGHTVTVTGSVSIATSGLFSGAAASFGGPGNYFDLGNSASFDVSSGDFTIEFQTCVTSTTQYYAISHRPSNGWMILLQGGSPVSWNQWTSAGNYNEATGPSLPTNQMVDVAIVRIGNIVTVYVNGVPGTPLDTSNRPSNSPGLFVIGRDPIQPLKTFVGYIRKLRFTTGVGRYPSAYSPSIYPFPTS